MRYTMKDIRESLPAEKRRSDGFWTVYVLRPLSNPVAWLALRMGLSADAVSYGSAFFSIGGAVLFALRDPWWSLAGALLLNFFAVLDCVDGNMARVTKKSGPWGGWADAVMGHLAYAAVFFATGVYAYLESGWWPFLLIAGITSSANLLMRVGYQMYRNIEPETAKGSVSLEMKLAETFGITGLLMPALVVCHLLGGVAYILYFNAAFYIGGCAVSLFKIARKRPAA